MKAKHSMIQNTIRFVITYILAKIHWAYKDKTLQAAGTMTTKIKKKKENYFILLKKRI
jgi:hypothetical protein